MAERTGIGVNMTTKRLGGKKRKNAPIPPLNDGSTIICKMKELTLSSESEVGSEGSESSDGSEDCSDMSDDSVSGSDSSGSESESGSGSESESGSDTSDGSGTSNTSAGSGTKRSRSPSPPRSDNDGEIEIIPSSAKRARTNEYKVELTTSESDLFDDRWAVQGPECPIEGLCMVPTESVETKYFTVVPLYVSGMPCHCHHWDKHFNQRDLTEFFSNLQISVKPGDKMRQHWDLFPSMISLKPCHKNKGQPRALTSPVFENPEEIKGDPRLQFKEKSEDFCVKISKTMTMILRVVSPGELRKRRDAHDWQNETVCLQLPMATHALGQKNLYLDKKVRDPMKAWALHQILNEKSIGISSLSSKSPVFLNRGDKRIAECSLLTIYQALYAVHAQEESV